MDIKPTKKQQQVLDAIKQFIKDHEYPPTVRDIAKIMGQKSPTGIHVHLKNLREKSLIKKQDGVARSITLNQEQKEIEIKKTKWECNQCLNEFPCKHETSSSVNLSGENVLCFYHQTDWKKVNQ